MLLLNMTLGTVGHLSSAFHAERPGNPCPKAPPGTAATSVNMIAAWTKWVVIALLSIGATISAGAVGVGRHLGNQRASHAGVIGLASCLGGAVALAVAYGVITAAVGKGC